MKIAEFVEFMKKNTNKTTREDQVVSLATKALEVKPYIGIKEKKELIDRIINKSIYYENGIFKFDGIEKYLYFTMYTIEAYTNVELSDDMEEDFDLLSSSKLLPVIVGIIQQEYDDVNVFLQMQCEYILEDNAIEAQIGKFLNEIIDKIGALGDKLQESVSNIDFSSLLKDKDKLINIFEKLNK